MMQDKLIEVGNAYREMWFDKNGDKNRYAYYVTCVWLDDCFMGMYKFPKC